MQTPIRKPAQTPAQKSIQKSTTVFSVPLSELEDQLADVASWPSFLPELESVTPLSNGRYTFGVRQEGHTHEVDVAVRRSPHGSGMIWTVVDGPAWNGHLYLQVVDGRRTRVHLELNVEPRSATGVRVATVEGDIRTRTEVGLVRLHGVMAHQRHPWRRRRVIEIPA
jgi:hypothetical protein